MVDEAALRSAVERFYVALLRTDRETLGVAFKDFPHGSCGDTSDLLSEYLVRSGFNAVMYVSGAKYDPELQSHAWVEVGDTIIDLTAHQFPGVADPILITRDRSWHAQFEPVEREPGGLQRVGDEWNGRRLAKIYARIKKNL